MLCKSCTGQLMVEISKHIAGEFTCRDRESRFQKYNLKCQKEHFTPINFQRCMKWRHLQEIRNLSKIIFKKLGFYEL